MSSRYIPPIHETASIFQSSAQPSKEDLKEDLKHHSYMRIQRLAIDLFMLYGKGKDTNVTTGRSKIQGLRGRKGHHGAHDSLNAPTRDDSLQKSVKRARKNGFLSPMTNRVLYDTYGWTPTKAERIVLTDPDAINDEDSLFWADRKVDRHHCTELPAWTNLIIDCRLERVMRPIISRYYELVLSMEMTVEEALDELVGQIQNYFQAASSDCTNKMKQLIEINHLEKEFYQLLNEWPTGPKVDGILSDKLIDCLQAIQTLQRNLKLKTEGAPSVKGIPAAVSTAFRFLPRNGKEIKDPRKTALKIHRTAITKGLIRSENWTRSKIWKAREEKISLYEKLAWANAICAEASQKPPLKLLFPTDPEEQKKLSGELTRAPGVEPGTLTPRTREKRGIPELPTPIPQETKPPTPQASSSTHYYDLTPERTLPKTRRRNIKPIPFELF